MKQLEIVFRTTLFTVLISALAIVTLPATENDNPYIKTAGYVVLLVTLYIGYVFIKAGIEWSLLDTEHDEKRLLLRYTNMWLLKEIEQEDGKDEDKVKIRPLWSGIFILLIVVLETLFVIWVSK